MQQVAQGWLVLELTGDPFALGVVGAAQFLPVLFLGLFGGVVADALPKRTSLLVTQAVSMGQAVVLGLLTISGSVEVWHVFVMALVLGTANAFDMPIRQAMVVETVDRDDVASAVALNSAVFNGARIVGPAVAGLLIGIVGLAACFFINAASDAAVIVALLRIRPGELTSPPRDIPERTARAVLEHLAAGLVYVRRTPAVLVTVFVVGVVSASALNFHVTLPLIARDLLAGGPETFGFLAAASGAGSLASAVVMAFGGRATLGRALLGAAVIGAATTATAFSGWLPASLVLMFIVGWGLIAMAATTNTIIQLTTPDGLRGRVMAVYTTVFAGSSPVGNVAVGALAARFGVGAALIAGGLVALACAGLVTLWALRTRQGLRRFRDRPAPG
ncbi:MFS transporter [soil metagenome]